MRNRTYFNLAGALTMCALAVCSGSAEGRDHGHGGRGQQEIQLGPRPFYLVEGMDPSPLKDRLEQCKDGPFRRSDFSIGHRGAALQFAEHTRQSYEAGARMGAGIVECDVTFTKDGELVCRHSECDLQTTTNIVATELNSKCSIPWTGPNQSPPPRCCTSDLTLAEFQSLQGKQDASVPGAATAQGYLGGTPSWRTDLYSGHGTLMTLRESLELNERNGVKHTPELKEGNAERIRAAFGGQEQYAQALVDAIAEAGIDPRRVFLQSFNLDDILYWIHSAPQLGRQAVYLDDIDPTAQPPIPGLTFQELRDLRRRGVRIFAPPFPALLDVDAQNQVVPSRYAREIRRAGLDIITWTFERADLRNGAGSAGFYYHFDPQGKAIHKDSDMFLALDVLAQDVGILGIFSDWPATVTYYANCMGL